MPNDLILSTPAGAVACEDLEKIAALRLPFRHFLGRCALCGEPSAF